VKSLISGFSGAVPVGVLVAFALTNAADAMEAAYIQPLNYQALFAPPVEPTSTDRIEREQALNFYKNLDVDQFKFTGFIASRRRQSSSEGVPDYRTYLGLRYQETLADAVQVSAHTFYGAGTYDGDNSYVNPKSGALPDEVRADGKPIGAWVGTDWQVNTKLFNRQTVQAKVEYRQPVETPPFDTDPTARKAVGFSAGSSYALPGDVSLNARVRLDGVASGYEVGMERKRSSGVRTGLSYGVQQLSDPLALTNTAALQRRLTRMDVSVPLLSNRIATAFELQYNDIAGPLLPQGRRDFVIGNLTVASGQIVHDTSLSFGLQNVFDTRGVDQSGQAIPFVPQDGRRLRLDVKRSF